jgi:PleD family two-component response regulator
MLVQPKEGEETAGLTGHFRAGDASERLQLTHANQDKGGWQPINPLDTDREAFKGGKFMLRTLILLVEDEAAIRAMTAMVLRRLGYLVQEASSGEEALRWAQSSREKIDLLMTDVLMPGINGRSWAKCSNPAAQSLRFYS